jgi:hypothetical protein
MPTGRPAADAEARNNGSEAAAAQRPESSHGSPRASRRDQLLDTVIARAFANDREFERYGRANGVPAPRTTLPGEPPAQDFLYAFENDPHEPDGVFSRLRWGGQFLYVSKHGRRVAEMNEQFGQRGFETMPRPETIRHPWFGLRLPLLSQKLHYFIARKVNLVLPRQFSERFTYHVQLVPADRSGHDYVVLKEVPSVARVMGRLQSKFPDAPTDLIEKRALKFTEKIFPLFLTREAALLQILERDLPAAYARRIPRVVGMDKDARGYVRRLKMTWLRVGTPRPLTQMDFARQAADLLHVVHERVGVIHLDLRLDNMVITDHGVGFVDFGSAVRVGENIQGNPLLANLYDELMRTSQIQRMIEKMTLSGAVTSTLIQGAYGRVDKQVDLFYLAMQMVQPLNNPDFRGLVEFDPTSREAAALSALKDQVLKPADPKKPVYKTAADVLRAILRIEQELKGRPAMRPMPEPARVARLR